MLGYVRAEAQELKVREQQYYRALYCGLCHRMGKCTGQCSRMTLRYDFVFLAALRLSLQGESPTIKRQNCILHPFRRRPTAQKCEALDYCADVSALLTYHKILDDLHDEHGWKRWEAFWVRPFFSVGYRRAKRRNPELDRLIGEHLSALSRLEEQNGNPLGADALAECFGELMADVFATGMAGTNERIARSIGYAIGRWIYLADAADDFAQDRKNRRFNPYLLQFGESPSEESWESIRLGMTLLLEDADRAFSLIDDYPTDELRAILANILYLGLPNTAVRIVKCASGAEVCEKQL